MSFVCATFVNIIQRGSNLYYDMFSHSLRHLMHLSDAINTRNINGGSINFCRICGSVREDNICDFS